MRKQQSKWQRWIGAYNTINKHRYQRLKNKKTESFYEKYIHKKPEKKVNPIMKYLNGLLWMAIPVGLIFAAMLGFISYMAAILLVILYHFLAMHIVIMMGGYLKK